MKEPYEDLYHGAPVEARDHYDLAKMWGIPLEKVSDRIFQEGWQFIGYSWEYGTALYVPPDSKNTEFL